MLQSDERSFFIKFGTTSQLSDYIFTNEPTYKGFKVKVLQIEILDHENVIVELLKLTIDAPQFPENRITKRMNCV